MSLLAPRLPLVLLSVALLGTAGCTCVDPASLEVYGCGAGCAAGQSCCDGVCREGACPGTTDAGGHCGPSTCAGCCSGDTCVGGAADQACGTGGLSCVDCLGLQCVSGSCTTPGADGGDDGGSPADGGGLDGGARDGGAPDGGGPDGGSPDGGARDGGSPDSGVDAGACLPAGSFCGLTSVCCAGTSCSTKLGLCTATTGETCATAAPLVFSDAGAASASANLSSATNDSAPTCGNSNGADLAYTFTTTAPRSLALSLGLSGGLLGTPTGSLSLQGGSCATPAPVYCWATADGGVSARVDSLPAGTWTVVVDAPSTFGGPTAQLGLQLSAVVVPDAGLPDAGLPDGGVVNACIGALSTTLPLSAGVSLPASPDTVSSGVCRDRGAEVVRLVTLSSPAALVAQARANFPTTVSVFGVPNGAACTEANLSTCADDPGTGSAVAITPVLDAGTWAVVVDSSGGSGAVALDVNAYAGEACASAIPVPLALDAGFVSLVGSVAGLANDTSVGCMGGASSTGPDLVYAFTLTQTTRVGASLAVSQGSRMAVEMQGPVTTCSGSANGHGCTEVRYSTNQYRNGSSNSLSAGTYLLVVDSDPATSPTRFNVVLQLENAPVPGENCGSTSTPNVFTADLSKPPVRIASTTLGAANDAVGCGFSGSPTVHVQLTAPKAGTLTATATPLLNGFAPQLSWSSTACIAAETACTSAAAAGLPVTLVTPVPQGTSWLTLSGSVDSAGPFALELGFQ